MLDIPLLLTTARTTSNPKWNPCPDIHCIIGNGVVIDPAILLEEMVELQDCGQDINPGRLTISSAAHIILPFHRSLDKARELALGNRKLARLVDHFNI